MSAKKRALLLLIDQLDALSLDDSNGLAKQHGFSLPEHTDKTQQNQQRQEEK